MQFSASTSPVSGLDLYAIQVRANGEYAMFFLDQDGILKSWNTGVENLFGYAEEEWVGQHASIIFSPADKAAEVCAAEMLRAAESGKATDIRWHRRKDGTELFANGFMNAVRDESGTLVGFAKIIRDETARKALEDSLTESNSALEQFAYVASHDLQEPLRTMCSYAQLLGRKYKSNLDADADEMLGFLVNAANRMSTMVRDLLTYARASAQEETPTSVALDEDLETALTHLHQSVEENGATVTHDALPVLTADRGQMVRLFQNLVGNALKYHQPERRPVIHISAEQRDTDWVVSVKDNGIGFEPKHAKQIFEPFKRLHTGQYSGNGVGLAICKRIVEAHGGRIWAESEPGQGATFFFSLPNKSPEAKR